MLVAVAADGSGGGWLCPVDDGAPATRTTDLAAEVARWEATAAPRWLWASTSAIYPELLRAGVRVARCHDLELTEALLLGHAGRSGEPRRVAAVLARRAGTAVPPDPPPPAPQPSGVVQESLFETAVPIPDDPMPDLIAAYADQRVRIAAIPAAPPLESPATSARPAVPVSAGPVLLEPVPPETVPLGAVPPAALYPEAVPLEAVPQDGSSAASRRFRLLVGAESAGALAAAEMGHYGLPWRGDVHDAVLAELLGPRSPVGGLPRRLAALSAAIADALGTPGLHPDSPAELRAAFARAGVDLPDTRAWSLRRVDHPAVPLVLEFKERYRIWTAHGWAWRDAWVQEGRFRPEYVPGGVVSGRWASRGGGALQIPKAIRRAVVADDGWRLVIADAGQLEPRILAAVSGDPRLAAAAGAGDLYAALASESFGGDRAIAKLALLGAMYGQTGGSALPAVSVLRRQYPTAWGCLERAARTGESGGLVRSWLGRTCPPPSTRGATEARARARGRFTRNFVIQATAAEWAVTMLAALRTGLAGHPAELVFFQHDEVLVHCPEDQVPMVTEAVHAAAEQARRLLFGATSVRFPLDLAAVRCYADAVHGGAAARS